MTLADHLALSRSSLVAGRWGHVRPGNAAVAIEEEEEQELGESVSKPRVQVVYVMNKARDLCARIRHQAKVKQREERKRILYELYVVLVREPRRPC